MVFQLGQRLGGRSEVVDAPVVELFGYLISDFERKEQDAKDELQRILLNHQSRSLAKPGDKKSQKANEKFVKQLQKQLQQQSGVKDNGHKIVGTAENNVIGTDNWDSLDKLKALENR
ncbi:hypothetical protein QI349_02600 [Staphylococcus saprophyticus]|nr:hypothetical protein [Staphylococcus saprophyticus]